MDNTPGIQTVTIDGNSRYLNGVTWARDCLGLQLKTSVNTFDLVTIDGMQIYLESLNQVIACARMYMQTIGCKMSIEIAPDKVVVSCQPPGRDRVQVNCWGDDLALCDSIVAACLMVNNVLKGTIQ